MKKNRGFWLKQQLKMLLQNIVLPFLYRIYRIAYLAKEPELIVFADAHHDCMPVSMVNIHDELEKRGYSITDVFHDYGAASFIKSTFYAMSFMRLYARAKYVFICDNFLPVVSCTKYKGTTVVQLWHSCGLLKKFGYDTYEDIPRGYRGEVYKNYDLVTVSAQCCVEVLRNAMRLDKGIVKALGVSRTDSYFDIEWVKECHRAFFAAYPEAKGKTIIVWAPTFRGNAGNPYQVGIEDINKIEKMLGDDFYVIKKLHPSVEKKYKLSNCNIQTERLFPVADILISDYSSVICEFMMFKKPYILFAKDREEYEKTRGFYVPYDSLSPYMAKDTATLMECITRALEDKDAKWTEEKCAYHLDACDGRATVRILDYLGL